MSKNPLLPQDGYFEPISFENCGECVNQSEYRAVTLYLTEYCTQSSDIPPLHHTIVGYILGICLETGGIFIHDFKAREIPFGDTSKLPLYHRSVDHTSIFFQSVSIYMAFTKMNM